jgi:hypothetical protein
MLGGELPGALKNFPGSNVMPDKCESHHELVTAMALVQTSIGGIKDDIKDLKQGQKDNTEDIKGVFVNGHVTRLYERIASIEAKIGHRPWLYLLFMLTGAAVAFGPEVFTALLAFFRAAPVG